MSLLIRFENSKMWILLSNFYISQIYEPSSAYSPMMAEMLSYLESKSSEYIWKQQKEIQFADENFAREIMQLFTIGLYKLNINGTTTSNPINGDTIPTYSNDDITEYARVWTGFRRQSQRGNTEERLNMNTIDPMAIHILWRDQFPKMGLDRNYIGDRYLLCSELPSDSFLQKNAKYRLLGKAKTSDLQYIPPGTNITTLDGTSSLLHKLCQLDNDGKCSYPGVVHLQEDLICSGDECNLSSSPQIVHIGDNVHYEYIKPPCVNFPFTMNNGVNIVIDSTGRVALERENSSPENFHSFTYFRVNWDNGIFPNVDNGCGYGACQATYGRCHCQTTVEEKRIFSSIPSRNDVLSQLHIGALSPEAYSYDGTEVYPGFKLHARNRMHMLGRHSTFEVEDDFGRTLYLKNMMSTVAILHWGTAQISQFGFRNAPSFYDDVPEVIEAQHETDAALDHYFYHPNTAPFLALRFIQRFGISNPSPRFVETVAQAFKSGTYTVPGALGLPSFGSEEYGDLSATIAAILLDRESRSVVVDVDPSYGGIREPLLRVVSTMRSMNYVQTNREFISLHNLQSAIGQSPHDLPSVFSFFLPEYAPPGVVAKASLVAPEAMLLQNSIGLLNGIISLVKYG